MAIWEKFISSADKDKKEAHEAWNRALKYFEGKLNNRALKDLQSALTLNPEYGPEAMDLMQTFSQQGNEEMALSVGFALLKMDSKNFELMNKLGNSLRNTNSFPKAKKLYTYALKINPQYSEAKYNLAASSFRITTNDGKLVSQTRKVEAFTEPRRFEFQGSRFGFFPVPNQILEPDQGNKKKGEDEEEEPDEEARKQMLENSIRQLRADVEGSGGSWESLFNLALIYDLNGIGELAVQNYREAAAKNRESREIINNLGVALMEHTSDLAGAESTLLQNLDRHPFDRATVLNLALCYRKQGKQFQTLKYFVYLGDLLEKSLGEFETDVVEAHARDLFERRKYLEAVPIFEHLALETQEEYWFEKLVVMYLNQKREDKYISTYKRLLRLNPEHEDARTKLTEYAANYEKESHDKLAKGSRHQAIESMVKAVQIEETPERLIELAQLYEDDGEEILAENALRRWKKITGAEPDAASAKQPKQAAAR